MQSYSYQKLKLLALSLSATHAKVRISMGKRLCTNLVVFRHSCKYTPTCPNSSGRYNRFRAKGRSINSPHCWLNVTKLKFHLIFRLKDTNPLVEHVY